jgi:hypothetical protein
MGDQFLYTIYCRYCEAWDKTGSHQTIISAAGGHAKHCKARPTHMKEAKSNE